MAKMILIIKVFLAVGISKPTVILQYMLETLLIAAALVREQ